MVPHKRSEVRDGWPVLLVAMSGSAAGLVGIAVFAFSFFIIPLHREFGWDRSDIGLAVSLLSLTLVVSGPAAGGLCDRYGTRRIIPASIALFSAGLAALTQIRGSVWTLYVGYVLLGVVGAGATYGCYSRAISTWFERNRGLALGLTACGPGIMAAAAPQFLPRVIALQGWRVGWLVLAGIALMALVPAFLFGGERVVPDGRQDDRRFSGMSFRVARKSREFWLLTVGIFIAQSGIAGLNVHLVPLVTELGVSGSSMRMVVTMFGISMVVSRIVTGYLLDRFSGPMIAAGIFLMACSALMVTVTAGSSAAVLAAMGLGVVTGAEGDLIGFFVSRYFGIAAYGEIFGWVYGAFALGAAFGPLLTGVILERTGTYHMALLAAAGCCAATAILFSRLGSYPSATPAAHRGIARAG